MTGVQTCALPIFQFYKDGDSFSDFVASKPEDFDEIDEDEDDDVI